MMRVYVLAMMLMMMGLAQAQNVGIGTNAPQAKLHVAGDLLLSEGVSISEFSTDGNLSGNSKLVVPTEYAVKTYIDSLVSTISLTGPGNSSAGNSGWSISGTKLYPTSTSYKVGIGTTNPGASLEVNGNGRFLNELRFRNNSTFKGIVWGNDWWSGTYSRIDDYNGQLHVMTDDKLYFTDIDAGNPGATTMFLNMDQGRVGIGTETPNANLQVNGNVFVNNELRFGNDTTLKGIVWGSNYGNNQYTRIDDYGGHPYFMTDDHMYFSDIDNNTGKPTDVRFYMNMNSGRMGIGTTTPDYTLDVNGTIRFGGFSSAEVDEYPNVTWLRDGANNWDEGLIKTDATRGAFNRAGFGIHLHSSRQFGFYSSGYKALWNIEGNTGRMYVRGSTGIGTEDPIQELDVNGRVQVAKGVIQKGGAAITNTTDLGLYSRDGSQIRVVTNNAPVRFYSDDAAGSNYHFSVEPNGQLLSDYNETADVPLLPESFCVFVPKDAGCPAGWDSREVRWDTENTNNADYGKDGKLAWDNGYNGSVRMHMCCRGSGW